MDTDSTVAGPLISRINGSRQEMDAKFKSVCRSCKGTVYMGDRVYYFPKTKKVEHYNCARRRTTTAGR